MSGKPGAPTPIIVTLDAAKCRLLDDASKAWDVIRNVAAVLLGTSRDKIACVQLDPSVSKQGLSALVSGLSGYAPPGKNEKGAWRLFSLFSGASHTWAEQGRTVPGTGIIAAFGVTVCLLVLAFSTDQLRDGAVQLFTPAA